jgi:hypothetical protein
MILMAKVTMDGQTGQISAVEGGYVPRNENGAPPYPLSGQPLKCLQEAMVGKPAVYFRRETPFTVSFPFAH